MLGYFLKEKFKLLIDKVLRKKLINQKQIHLTNYNFEEAEQFNDFNRIVPFSDKEFWVCIGIKIVEEDEMYIVHTKSNIVFSRNLKLLGRAIKENGMLYLTELEDIDTRFVEWYYKCLDATYEVIRETNVLNKNKNHTKIYKFYIIN
jgi:murein L,D-transpeptidase YafK